VALIRIGSEVSRRAMDTERVLFAFLTRTKCGTRELMSLAMRMAPASISMERAPAACWMMAAGKRLLKQSREVCEYPTICTYPTMI
jgi:hypothetical protein